MQLGCRVLPNMGKEGPGFLLQYTGNKNYSRGHFHQLFYLQGTFTSTLFLVTEMIHSLPLLLRAIFCILDTVPCRGHNE